MFCPNQVFAEVEHLCFPCEMGQIEGIQLAAGDRDLIGALLPRTRRSKAFSLLRVIRDRRP